VPVEQRRDPVGDPDRARRELSDRLLPALAALRTASREGGEFSDVLKIGRTHLQDASR